MQTNGLRPERWVRRRWLAATRSEAARHAHLVDGRLIVSAPVRPDAPRIARRRSPVHGWGVFALERVPKNRRIVEYAGELLPNRLAAPREERYLKGGCIWCFELNRLWVVDAGVGGNVARFINHSCLPNCHSRVEDGLIWICASRTIEPGEELAYNYFTRGAAEIPCRCRPGCRNTL